MATMTGWDVAILLIAAYLSIVTLVRLMRNRRDQLVARYRTEIAEQQVRKRAEDRRRRRQERQDRPAAAPQMRD